MKLRDKFIETRIREIEFSLQSFIKQNSYLFNGSSVKEDDKSINKYFEHNILNALVNLAADHPSEIKRCINFLKNLKMKFNSKLYILNLENKIKVIELIVTSSKVEQKFKRPKLNDNESKTSIQAIESKQESPTIKEIEELFEGFHLHPVDFKIRLAHFTLDQAGILNDENRILVEKSKSELVLPVVLSLVRLNLYGILTNDNRSSIFHEICLRLSDPKNIPFAKFAFSLLSFSGILTPDNQNRVIEKFNKYHMPYYSAQIILGVILKLSLGGILTTKNFSLITKHVSYSEDIIATLIQVNQKKTNKAKQPKLIFSYQVVVGTEDKLTDSVNKLEEKNISSESVPEYIGIKISRSDFYGEIKPTGSTYGRSNVNALTFVDPELVVELNTYDIDVFYQSEISHSDKDYFENRHDPFPKYMSLFNSKGISNNKLTLAQLRQLEDILHGYFATGEKLGAVIRKSEGDIFKFFTLIQEYSKNYTKEAISRIIMTSNNKNLFPAMLSGYIGSFLNVKESKRLALVCKSTAGNASESAKQRDEAFLKTIELIAEQTNDDKLKFKLGQAYFDGFGNHLSALKNFKELADRNDLAAIQYISSLAKSSAECAFIIGKLYEKNAKGEEQLLKSCVYYIIATQHKQGGTHSTLAKTYLERFRNSKQLTIKNLTLIGQKYVSGSDGILRDYIEARRWFEKSSELGCEVAHYELGNFYQLALGVAKDLSEAARHYQLAVNKGHALAKGKLDALLASREIPLAGLIAIAPFNSEAEYMIGVDHYHRQHNLAEAINWCLRAAERGHAKATAYLTDTSFSADHYLTIAKRYDQGDRVVKNTNTAITFYKKACALNNKHAAFRLGQLHYAVLDENKSAPAGLETKGSPKEQSTRMLQAFEYYFIAAKQRDEASLKAMELIAAQVGDDKLKFKLAQAYLDGFGDLLLALKIFKELADQNDLAAVQHLQTLAKNKSGYAFIVGKLYEENAKSEEHFIKACVYYIIATQHKSGTIYSELAKTHLERLCNSDQLTTKDLNTFAQRYFKGDDEIEKDYVKARQWFEKASERDCELAHYELGNLYQAALGVTRDFGEAARHYQLAVNKGHALAKSKLDALLASREIPLAGLIAIAPFNSEAEYMIGVDHYHRQHNFAEAINWCLRAAERGHAKATTYLTDTSFSADHYLTIAKRYDQGDRVVKNTNTAITFYKKACALNNKHAAFRLGQLHYAVLDEIKSAPAGLETKEPSKEQSMAVQQAFDYYFIAAKQGDEASLKAMELIAEQASDNKLKFKLGQAYLDGFGNHLSALKFFKELADQNDLAAVQHLQTLAKNKTEYAFTVGKLYEENAKSEEHFIKACVYYIIATQHKQSDIFSASAVTYLERLGNSFELTAKNLTTIGQKYSCGIDGVIRDYVEARRWFVKACEKGCAVAHYELGNLYQAALGVTKDDGQAARFYQLAYNKGYALAKEKLDSLLDSREISSAGLIAIASIYQSGADGIEKDWPRVASLYQRAAERGDKVAALHLGQFYQIDHVGVKRNITLAFHFYLQAAKLGNHEALNPLERLAEEVSSDQQLALSQAYASFFHKPEKSIYWREKSREVQEFKFIS